MVVGSRNDWGGWGCELWFNWRCVVLGVWFSDRCFRYGWNDNNKFYNSEKNYINWYLNSEI